MHVPSITVPIAETIRIWRAEEALVAYSDEISVKATPGARKNTSDGTEARRIEDRIDRLYKLETDSSEPLEMFAATVGSSARPIEPEIATTIDFVRTAMLKNAAEAEPRYTPSKITGICIDAIRKIPAT